MVAKLMAVGAALFALGAWAQSPEKRPIPGTEGISSDVDLDVKVNAGVSSFTGGLADHTNAGTAWGVSVGADRWGLVGVEVAYEGSRHPLEPIYAADGAAMFRNGVSGLARVGPTLEMENSNLRPYVGAGLGISYLNVNDRGEGRYQNDVMEEVPFALGLDYSRGFFTAGVRGTYRVLIDEEFAEPIQVGSTEGSLFTTTLNVGGKF
jgi:hypothetical protein